MFTPDTDATRQFAREHHAELKRDWQWVNPAQPDVVESRRRRWRIGFAWLLAHLRPIGHAT